MNTHAIQLLWTTFVINLASHANASPEHKQSEQYVLDRLTWGYQSSMVLPSHISEDCVSLIDKIAQFDHVFIPNAVNTSNVVSKTLLPILEYLQLFSNFKENCFFSLDRRSSEAATSEQSFRSVLASTILNRDFLGKHIRIESILRNELQHIVNTEKISIDIGKKYSIIYERIKNLIHFYRHKAFKHLVESSQQEDYKSFEDKNKENIDAFTYDFYVYYYFITCQSVFDVILFVFSGAEETDENKGTLELREFIKRIISAEKQGEMLKSVKENIKEFIVEMEKVDIDDLFDEKLVHSKKLTVEAYLAVQGCENIIKQLVDVMANGLSGSK